MIKVTTTTEIRLTYGKQVDLCSTQWQTDPRGGGQEPLLPAIPADTMCTWVESGSSTPFSFSLAVE